MTHSSQFIDSRQNIGARLSGRPTFGFIVNWGLSNPYSSPMWWGAAIAAETLDVNLIGFGDINIYDLARNPSLYRQIDPASLDGLVLVNAIYPRLPAGIFSSVPIVNIGYPMEDVISSILIDNHEGMRSIVRHMIEIHGCKKIAYIKGPTNNPDAAERFRAYQEELEGHGLTIDPDLLYQPFDWSPPGGREGVRTFLDENQAKFDALIGANDNLALSAMAELQRRKIHVPYDVAVCGFDDALESATSTPTLTTVRQPTQKMGLLALEALLAYHQGKSVPPRLFLPTTLLLRRSCGCVSGSVANVNQGMPAAQTAAVSVIHQKQSTAVSLLRERREVLIREMQRAASVDEEPIFSETAGKWLEALMASLENSDDGEAFLTAIDLTFRRLMEHQTPVAGLQNVLSALRREGCRALAEQPASLAQAENLWHRARVFINELTLQQQNQKRLQINDQMAVLHSISQTMAVTFHLENLMEILVRDLTLLGIESCYVAVYEGVNRPADKARLILANRNGHKLALKGKKHFPVSQLLPEEMWGTGRRTMVLEALEFQSEEIGYVLFEVGPQDGAIYEALRSQLGSSIKGAVLFDERDHLLTKTTQLYRQAAAGQRLAEEANRLKSRFLSMVSHELSAPLHLITGLSELTLQEANSDKPLNGENLKLMHVTAQHLDTLVRDVLDLAREEMGQLRLVCEPIDLSNVLEAVVVLGEQLAQEHHLKWRYESISHLPLIWGDPTRLRQVVLNLLNNAVKFTEKGEVRLRVAQDGERVTVSVSDTGLGIPPAEQGVIFDEFRQSDRTSARGYGGLGLGLAICRRLVNMHGGEIAVRSSGIEGEGATFFFSLPTLKATPVDVGQHDSVWILTSDRQKAEGLCLYLKDQGLNAEVHLWDRAGKWLAHAVQDPPTAIVVDGVKSHKRGLEAMKSLRANPVTNEVGLVFYTLQEGRDNGAVLELDFLNKPLNTNELVKALQRLGKVHTGTAVDEMAGSCQTILIVDDDAGILDMHSQMVRAKYPQHQILTASNGKEALDRIKSSRPDLVLLDLMMPEMDGFTVLEEMQKLENAHQVPVIVISAKTLTEEEMARLNRSVAVILRKGMFTSAETLDHIKDSLLHRQKLSSEAQRVTRKAMAFIHEHSGETIGREDVARYAGVSEGYLSRCFTQETGCSLIHYITRYRIQQAKQLLSNGDLSITEIALEVGFSDSNYFSRAFRREVGLSPLAFRRKQ